MRSHILLVGFKKRSSMSLSSKNLSSIQKAGQATHDASEAIAATVRTQAESMVSSMATAPFSAESEQAISRFKTLSKLSQGLAAVEAQLQELYAVAAELASSASDVIVLKEVSKRKAITNAAAVDVVAKPAKAAKKAKKTGRKALTLTANDNKLLAFLQKALKSGNQTAITGNAMADGSGLPLGSVGVALNKILTLGAVKKVDRGTYQLSATAVVPAAEPVGETVVKSSPAKKARPAVAKKTKAAKAEVPAVKEVKPKAVKVVKAVKPEVSVAKEVKAKPAKKAAAAPARKVKAPAAKKVKAVAEPAAPTAVSAAPAVEAEAAPV
jgi:hypothetical protein